MSRRRILSIWFPRLAAERILRTELRSLAQPFAVVEDQNNMQVILSLCPAASAEGLRRGQPLRDAQAMCPNLITRLAHPQADAAFLTVLQRWAVKFSPWVAEDGRDGLIIDLTGCAHLFGGEETLLQRLEDDCTGLGLSIQAGIADTVGAAWALARYAGHSAGAVRSGDAIDQEAYATRARAAKRRNWEKGGAAPHLAKPKATHVERIAAPDRTHSTLAPLPVAALRIDDEVVEGLTRLGLRVIGDLTGMPRAALARRFGQQLVMRLDQALGSAKEPVSPAPPSVQFAVRLTLPEPIGLVTDVIAGIDRLLPELERRLKAKGRGVRTLRLQLFRVDNSVETLEVGLARPSASPDRMRPLLVMKLDAVDAGFGIDCLRLEAIATEPVHPKQHSGHADATDHTIQAMGRDTRVDDLIGRLGARVGLDTIQRCHPASSHIPEKATYRVAAHWSDPVSAWRMPVTPRPILLWRPEPVAASDDPFPPDQFRWRGRDLSLIAAIGPERIAPEWWLDEPEWRSGVRDYWRVTVQSGERFWLFFAHGAALSAGWFCQGRFA